MPPQKLKIYEPSIDPYLDIIYQDDDLLVLNKQSGLLTVPGKHIEHRDSLEVRAQRVFPTATIVHRLDMPTSGVLLMALNIEAHRFISWQFEHRKTKKTYIARVFGQLAGEGEVDLPLICDWPNRPKQMVCHERGKKSLTRYKVISREDQSCRVELYPETGRSHQLRVHMLAIGHAILGDNFYQTENSFEMAERLQLHAHILSVRHPVTEEEMIFTAPVPF
jgi:tRNA pseudouridine32 synthase/23S rRNA pseudouridine746 synthase